jgi:hypothetical protein
MSVEGARAAEDYILEKGKAAGHGSLDHSEFLTGITMRTINELFSEAISVGLAEDKRVVA